MIFKWILIAAVSAALINGVYSNIKISNWKKSPDPSGTMVDVGGHEIYMRVMGNEGPTVIIENAAASTMFEWDYIQKELSKHVRVVSYDRPGYGYSDKAKTSRNSDIISDELYAALKKQNIPGPYIVVTHSQGALYANHFIRKHPGEIKGAVFLDPIVRNNGFEKELNPDLVKKFINKAPMMKMAKTFASIGLAGLFKSSYINNISEDVKNNVVNHYSSSSTFDTAFKEYENVHNGFDAVHKAGPFPDIPIAIVYHSPEKNIELMKKYKASDDDAKKVEELWKKLIKEEYSTLSKNCRWVVADKSTHSIHTEQPDLVNEIILELVK